MWICNHQAWCNALINSLATSGIVKVFDEYIRTQCSWLFYSQIDTSSLIVLNIWLCDINKKDDPYKIIIDHLKRWFPHGDKDYHLTARKILFNLKDNATQIAHTHC